MTAATDWIEALDLSPHPEGGFYREFHRSEHVLEEGSLPRGFSGSRELGSVIHYLLTGKDSSAFHRLRSDEIWHFHDGSPFLIHMIDPKGVHTVVRLGLNVTDGEVPCFVVPGGYYFGAEVATDDSFALASCTVIPAFSFDDFEMPTSDELISIFPHLKSKIQHLSRKGT